MQVDEAEPGPIESDPRATVGEDRPREHEGFHKHREAHRHDGQVEPAHAQCRHAQQECHGRSDERAHENCERERQMPARRGDRRHERAQPHEPDVTERQLACSCHQRVQAEGDDGEDGRDRQAVGQRLGHQHPAHGHRGDGNQPRRPVGGLLGQ